MKSLFREQKIKAMDIDFSGITYIDSAAALAIIQIQKAATIEIIDCSLINLSDETKGIFSVIHEKALTQSPFKAKETHDGLVTQIGSASLNIVQDVANFITFAGDYC